jgi:hypothetical protein
MSALGHKRTCAVREGMSALPLIATLIAHFDDLHRAGLPIVAGAQQRPPKIPRIGIIDDAPIWDHFRRGLREPLGLSLPASLLATADDVIE